MLVCVPWGTNESLSEGALPHHDHHIEGFFQNVPETTEYKKIDVNVSINTFIQSFKLDPVGY